MERRKSILFPLIIAAGLILIIKMITPAYAAEVPAGEAAEEAAAGENAAGETAAVSDITLPVYWVKECRNADEAVWLCLFYRSGNDMRSINGYFD